MQKALSLPPEAFVSVRELQAAAAELGPSVRHMLPVLLAKVAGQRNESVPEEPKP